MLHCTLSIDQICTILNAELVGNGTTIITRLAKIEDASQGDISFVASDRFVALLQVSNASCILVKKDQELPENSATAFLRCADPHRSFIQLIRYLQAQQEGMQSGISPAATIGHSSAVSSKATIHAGVVVGEHCTIDDDVVLHPNVVLGNHVHIGSATVLFAGTVVYDDCTIGRNCIVHAQAVIGSDGFGYLENSDGSFDKIPQIGNVVIDDDVEIGANSCIDRAALGSTRIGKGVKIDNLVHIAHNVEIGANTAIAAQCGIAGATKIGERNRLAGQVGVVGYIQTASDVTIGAQSGVSKSLNQAGVYSGSPAVELKQRLRQEATIRRLSR